MLYAIRICGRLCPAFQMSWVRFEPQKTTVKRAILQAGLKVSSGKPVTTQSLGRFSSEEKNKEQNMLVSVLQNPVHNSQSRTTILQANRGHEDNSVQQDKGLLLGDKYNFSSQLSQYSEMVASRFSQIQTAQTNPLLPSAFTPIAGSNSTSNRNYGNIHFSEKMASQSECRVDHRDVQVNIYTSSPVSGHTLPEKGSSEISKGLSQPSKPGYFTGISPVTNLNVDEVTGPLKSGGRASIFPVDMKPGMNQPLETLAVSQPSTSFSALSLVKPSVSSPVPLFSSSVSAKASSSPPTVSTGILQNTLKHSNDIKQTPPTPIMSASSAASQSLTSSHSSSFQYHITQSSSSPATPKATLALTSQASFSSLVSTSYFLPCTSPLQSKDIQSLTSFPSNASTIPAERSLSSSTASISTSPLQSQDSQPLLSRASSTVTISQTSLLTSTSTSSVVTPLSSTGKSLNEKTAKNQNNPSGPTGLLFSPISTTIPSSSPATTSSSALAKSNGLDPSDIPEDDMEEEAPEPISSLGLGSLGGFGLGSNLASSAPKSNPFGGSLLPTVSSPASSMFSVSTPPGQLFKPASLSIPSAQQIQSSSPLNQTGGSGSFGGFGQPAQIGSGQQALGSALGAFGQSRQLGNSAHGGGLSSGGFGSSAGGFPTVPNMGGGFARAAPGGGFGGSAPGGGFAGAAPGGGFAALASGTGGFASAATGGGFASVASGTGGFASAATGGGFASLAAGTGGFSGAPTGGGFTALSAGTGGFAIAGSGGGFSAIASTGGGGGGFAGAAGGNGFAGASGFGAVGSGAFGATGSTGAGKPPPQLLMQMRK